MKNHDSLPIQLALFGMDERTSKTMAMYLKGPCKGIAIVVDELNAEVDLIDADHVKAKELIAERKSKARPIILLSLEELSIEGTINVKKPVQKAELVSALKQINKALATDKPRVNREFTKQASEFKSVVTSSDVKHSKSNFAENRQAGIKHIDLEEVKKISKHRSAKKFTETSFPEYIGLVDGEIFSNREPMLNASFNPKEFFLGYVQSALKTCKSKGRNLQLNLGWKPLVIFPHSQEIWLDADDKQLRAFAGQALKKSPSQDLSLSSIDQTSTDFTHKMDEIYDMDHFLWKLAVWTSKGRYPETIDINKPIFLNQWPNFTRLIVTPHAMRIAALLVMGPRTAMDIAAVLNIKPQYVFVFISAANVLGLVGQATRQVDELIVPPEVKELESKGLLTRILGRLRG